MGVVVGVLGASVSAQFLGNLLYVIVRILRQPGFWLLVSEGCIMPMRHRE
jgi:hypothetical protein